MSTKRSVRTGYLFSNVLLSAKQRRIIWSGEYVKNLYQIHDCFENILQVNGVIAGFETKEVWNDKKKKPIDVHPFDMYEFTISAPHSVYWDSAVFPYFVDRGDWVYYEKSWQFYINFYTSIPALTLKDNRRPPPSLV